MTHIRLSLLHAALWFVAVASWNQGTANATAGFAEWEVRTPGGNFICHTDPYLSKFKIWLSVGCQEEAALVERLHRWRYYEGFVVGEAERGDFVFDERRRDVIWLSPNVTSESEANARHLAPISDWLSPGDGYAEAWFTPLTWKFCRDKLRLEPKDAKLFPEKSKAPSLQDMNPFNPSRQGCQLLLERLDGYYKRTMLKMWCEELPQLREQSAAAPEATEGLLAATEELCKKQPITSPTAP